MFSHIYSLTQKQDESATDPGPQGGNWKCTGKAAGMSHWMPHPPPADALRLVMSSVMLCLLWE